MGFRIEFCLFNVHFLLICIICVQKTTHVTGEQFFQTGHICVTIAQIKKHNVTSEAPFHVPPHRPLRMGTELCSDLEYRRLIFLFLTLVQMETCALGSSCFLCLIGL